MTVRHSIFLILLFFYVGHLLGQNDIKTNPYFLLFEDASTSMPVLVDNDSIAYTGYSFSVPKKFQFPKNLNRWEFNEYQFSLDGMTYLVEDGCGPVLQFTAEGWKRSDQSFRHRNQYGAIPFVYNNELFLWGGYGLFTLKNIFTFFDRASGEWNVQSANNEALVEPRCFGPGYVANNSFYVFGGQVKDMTKKDLVSYKYDSRVYKFDFNTLEWEKVGFLVNPEKYIFPVDNARTYFEANGKYYIVGYYITEIDVINNTCKTFEQLSYKSIKSIIFHSSNNSVSYVYIDSDSNFRVRNESFDVFKGKLIHEGRMYWNNTLIIAMRMLAALLAAILLLIALRRVMSKINKGNSALLYDVNTDEISYKGNTLDTISELQKKLLKLFFNHPNQYLLLSDLNDVIAKSDTDYNYTRLNKQRELTLKDLSYKIALLTGQSDNAIFTFRKNQEDKRIKEIQLNIKTRIKK